MKIIFLISFAWVQFSYAGTCDTEMLKFTGLSSERQKQICGYFTDTPSFTEFKSCVLSVAKKFNKSATDGEIFATPENDLNGILSVCGAPSASSSKIKTEVKPAPTGAQ